MLKSIGHFLAKHLQSLFNFLVSLLSGILEVLWTALAKVFSSLFSLLSTIWGRFLATITLIASIALSPLVDFIKSALVGFASLLGASPDVFSSLFPPNFQALCYVAVTFCSLDIMLGLLVTFLVVKSGCYSIELGVWAARKIASVIRGAGV